jgi:Fic family protein
MIKGVEMRVRRLSGTALAGEKGKIVYTPPEGEDLLRSLLANWERFLHEETQIDPLIRMAVGHYQFEAIHPFTDGNGRTGRVLNSLFLIHEGLLTLPILYLSRYIIQNRADYYRLLLEVTCENNWEGWLLYLIGGVQQTADWTRIKIEAIRKLFEHTSQFIRDRRPKIYSYELLSLIFELPYCRIQNVVQAGIAKRQAASRYLNELVEIGVLQDQVVGREKLFLHPKYLKLLTQDDDFTAYS